MIYVVKCPFCNAMVGCEPNQAGPGQTNEVGQLLKNEVACSRCNEMISTENGTHINEPQLEKKAEDIDLLKVD